MGISAVMSWRMMANLDLPSSVFPNFGYQQKKKLDGGQIAAATMTVTTEVALVDKEEENEVAFIFEVASSKQRKQVILVDAYLQIPPPLTTTKWLDGLLPQHTLSAA